MTYKNKNEIVKKAQEMDGNAASKKDYHIVGEITKERYENYLKMMEAGLD